MKKIRENFLFGNFNKHGLNQWKNCSGLILLEFLSPNHSHLYLINVILSLIYHIFLTLIS